MAISRRVLNRIAFAVGVVGLGSCVGRFVYNDCKQFYNPVHFYV